MDLPPPQFVSRPYPPGAIDRRFRYLYRPILLEIVLQGFTRWQNYTCSTPKLHDSYTQDVKGAAVEAGIARCKAKLRACHRIAFGSGVIMPISLSIWSPSLALASHEAADEEGDPNPAPPSTSEPCQDMALLILLKYFVQEVRA